MQGTTVTERNHRMNQTANATSNETFARWTFRLAGIYGLVLMLPLYFAEERIARELPPAITHPELFYGFIGVVVAWQVAFLVIAQHPARYHPLMLVAVLEKFGYGIAVTALFHLDRVPVPVFVFGIVELLLGAMFLLAFWTTPSVTASANWRE
jgi:hypothetical protein